LFGPVESGPVQSRWWQVDSVQIGVSSRAVPHTMSFIKSGFVLLLLFTAVILYLNTQAFISVNPVVVSEPIRPAENKHLREGGEVVSVPKSRNKKRIAYAITVTKDGPFVDGALVLGYAALKVHDEKHGFRSKYDASLVAFVTPGVVTARTLLASHGWTILEKTVPVSLDEIQNKAYVDAV
jgi:hypothetical protein